MSAQPVTAPVSLVKSVQAPEGSGTPESVTPAPRVPALAPKPAASSSGSGTAKVRKTPDVPTLATRVNKLCVGDRLVRNDIGIVTVVSLVRVKDSGRLVLTYTKTDGSEGTMETWPATHARIEIVPVPVPEPSVPSDDEPSDDVPAGDVPSV